MSKLLEQSDEAAELARQAFACGNEAVGIDALQLAAQLVQLARLTAPHAPSQRFGDGEKR